MMRADGSGYLKRNLTFQQDERKEVGWNRERRLLEVKASSLCQQKKEKRQIKLNRVSYKSDWLGK